MDFRLIGAIAQLAGHQARIECERRGKRLRYVRIWTPRTIGLLPLPIFAAHIRRYCARHPLAAEAPHGFPALLIPRAIPPAAISPAPDCTSAYPEQADPSDPWGAIEDDIRAEHDAHIDLGEQTNIQCLTQYAISLCLLLSLVLSPHASASEFLLTRALPTDYMLSPPTYTYAEALQGPLIGTGPARWHIAQWGIRDALSLDRFEIREDGWQLWSDDASVTLQHAPDGRNELDFWHSALDPASGCREFDLFIEPNAPFSYPTERPGFVESARPLSQLRRLIVAFSQEIYETWSGSRCRDNISGAGLGLILVNLQTTPPQAFFYQIATYESRNELFDGVWFYTGIVDDPFITYGAVDSPEHFGYRGLIPGAGMAAYEFNLLARVRELITTNPYGMDTDTGHWLFRGVYIGTAVNGEAYIRSRLGKVRIYSE